MNETVRRTSGAASATTLVAIAILGLVLAASMGKFAGGAHVGLLHVPDAPILLVSDGRENFGRYYAEILQTEGFAAFAVADVSSLDARLLDGRDIVILATTPISADQADALTHWVNEGGNLIAMNPHPRLDDLLGIERTGSTLSEGYVRVSRTNDIGRGITAEAMQFHGLAQLVNLHGAAAVATLYSTRTMPASHPAITLRSVGSKGGQAAAFTYDLATSIVYTRQGNPAWAGQERDGRPPIRPNDLFYGASPDDPQADWVDLENVAIPQADEQQRLLANLIVAMTGDRKPLPRFWYFPRGHKAVVVMTGDDHGKNGTTERFERAMAASPAGCSVEKWECVRATSYMYPHTPMNSADARRFEAAGFELGLHFDSGCADYTRWRLEAVYVKQIARFQLRFPGLAPLRTQRHHCIAFSDWSTALTVQSRYGIRLDTNYYYWPPEWVADRPGHFTGSAMPMRFADLDGSVIDVYQVVTQLTDESSQRYPFTIDTLLDRALGEDEHYGVYTINAHTDVGITPEFEATLASALSRGVPIISARQLLQWLDGRNASTLSELSWQDDALTFTVARARGADGLRTLLPRRAMGRTITTIVRDGANVPYELVDVNGISYAAFDSPSGTYTALYLAQETVSSQSIQ